jgi:hypothetical protein
MHKKIKIFKNTCTAITRKWPSHVPSILSFILALNKWINSYNYKKGPLLLPLTVTHYPTVFPTFSLSLSFPFASHYWNSTPCRIESTKNPGNLSQLPSLLIDLNSKYPLTSRDFSFFFPSKFQGFRQKI